MVRELTDADEAGMELALAEARAAGGAGEVPVGAVILLNGEVIGRGQNRILRDNDPTAHAEMLAIRSATSQTGMKWLNDCDAYVTLEPCAMCAGALVLARVSRLVFGADDPKTGACGSLRNIVDDSRLNHRIDVRRSVLEEPCSEMLKRFFQDLRRKNA
ncbi:MAG: tRNA adenosine(34) deaminase TadA [Gemmatimonadetes bacterium]|nr:tRNA adenosine(34) deaminase TadA [Gemmatimonadota bacterium]